MLGIMKIVYACIAYFLFKSDWFGSGAKIPGLGCRNTLTNPIDHRRGTPSRAEIRACVTPCEKECKNANEPDLEIQGFIVRLCVVLTCGNGMWRWPEIEGIRAPGCHNKLDPPVFGTEKEAYIYEECVKSCEKDCYNAHRRKNESLKDWGSQKSFIQSCVQDKCPDYEGTINIPTLLEIIDKVDIHNIAVIPPGSDDILMHIKEDEGLTVETVQKPNTPTPVDFEEIQEIEIAPILIRLNDEGVSIKYDYTSIKPPLPPHIDLSSTESIVNGIIGKLNTEVNDAYIFKYIPAFGKRKYWEYDDNAHAVLHKETVTTKGNPSTSCDQYTISTAFKVVKDLEAQFEVQIKMSVDDGSKYTVEDLKRAVKFDSKWNELIFVDSDSLSVIFKTNPLKITATYVLLITRGPISECIVNQRASESGHALQTTACECDHCYVN